MVFHVDFAVFLINGRENRKAAKHGPLPECLWTQERTLKLPSSSNYFSKSPVSECIEQIWGKK
jgi:hypothetical protein